jgi:hypothetical protein
MNNRRTVAVTVFRGRERRRVTREPAEPAVISSWVFVGVEL